MQLQHGSWVLEVSGKPQLKLKMPAATANSTRACPSMGWWVGWQVRWLVVGLGGSGSSFMKSVVPAWLQV